MKALEIGEETHCDMSKQETNYGKEYVEVEMMMLCKQSKQLFCCHIS